MHTFTDTEIADIVRTEGELVLLARRWFILDFQDVLIRNTAVLLTRVLKALKVDIGSFMEVLARNSEEGQISGLCHPLFRDLAAFLGLKIVMMRDEGTEYTYYLFTFRPELVDPKADLMRLLEGTQKIVIDGETEEPQPATSSMEPIVIGIKQINASTMGRIYKARTQACLLMEEKNEDVDVFERTQDKLRYLFTIELSKAYMA